MFLNYLWPYPLLLGLVIVLFLFFLTRPRDWYYRQLFRVAMWKIRLIGPRANVFPPSSKPPSPENIAFTSIFAQFPKNNIDKSVSERRIAFSRLGALQSINPEVKFKPTLQVPLLPSTNNATRTTVSVHPILPAVSVHGKINIYLHGGTYISGSIHSHAGFVSQITELSHRLTYFVEYALGPEGPVPQGVSDVVSVYDWLIREKNTAPNDIIIVGDSAGGGLALLTALELRKRGMPMPAGIWVLSPWTDLSCTGTSWKTHLKSDVMLNPHDFRAGSLCLAQATGLLNSTVEQLQNPDISPLFATDLTQLPPILVQVGGSEMLLSDSIEMHKKLVQARVKSTLQIYDHQQHIFQLFYDWIPEAGHAMVAGIRWMNLLDQIPEQTAD